MKRPDLVVRVGWVCLGVVSLGIVAFGVVAALIPTGGDAPLIRADGLASAGLGLSVAGLLVPVRVFFPAREPAYAS